VTDIDRHFNLQRCEINYDRKKSYSAAPW
jgi:hypothetical protein